MAEADDVAKAKQTRGHDGTGKWAKFPETGYKRELEG